MFKKLLSVVFSALLLINTHAALANDLKSNGELEIKKSISEMVRTVKNADEPAEKREILERFYASLDQLKVNSDSDIGSLETIDRLKSAYVATSLDSSLELDNLATYIESETNQASFLGFLIIAGGLGLLCWKVFCKKRNNGSEDDSESEAEVAE